jgi:hypothetical protein
MSPAGETRPYHLGSIPKRPQPAPHRALATTQRQSNTAITHPSGIIENGPTNRLHIVATTHQPAPRQTNMRPTTRPTPRTTRTNPLLHTRPTQRAPPAIPPRAQNTPTQRADQPPRHQVPLDLDLIHPYHEHRCLRHHQGRALPAHRSRTDGRALTRPRHQSLARHPQTQPPQSSPSATIQTPRILNQRGAQQLRRGRGGGVTVTSLVGGVLDGAASVNSVRHLDRPGRVQEAGWLVTNSERSSGDVTACS